jgi:hypothetical protein
MTIFQNTISNYHKTNKDAILRFIIVELKKTLVVNLVILDIQLLKLKKFVVNNVNQDQLIDKLLMEVLLVENVTLIVKQQMLIKNVLNVKQDILKFKLQDINLKINLFVSNQRLFHIAKNITLMELVKNVSITYQKMHKPLKLLIKL